MRLPLVALLLVLPALAGCAAEEAEPTLAAVQTARIVGTVTTESLEPLEGVRVFVPDPATEARTDASGRFEFTLPLGEYLVLTDAPLHINTAQRARLDGPDVTLSFALREKPTQEPGTRSYEARGLLSCSATVKTGDGHSGGNAQTYNCGSSDPNNRASLDFFLEPEPGISGVVIEMAWEPVSQAGKTFTMHAFQVNGGSEEEIGEDEGEGYVSIVIPPSVAQFRFAQGGTLRTLAVPAGSFLDEESPADAGVMFAQEFTVYVTVFSNAPPPQSFSVLG